MRSVAPLNTAASHEGWQEIRHVSTPVAYQPEDNPFQTIMVDLTHRCNMACHNCYIPNRDIPDMDLEWLAGILARLPRRARIRLAGAEPTMRADLPDIIRRVRRLGHTPLLLTNGLRISHRKYVRTLKQAGLRTVYLSLNGGFDDAAYEAIDGLRCAKEKQRALQYLSDERMYISLGMILVRDVNTHLVGRVYDHIRADRQVYELKLRSVGQMGRYMQTDAFRMDELVALASAITGIPVTGMQCTQAGETYRDFRIGRLKIQLTEWPDLRNPYRGRLAPDGTIQPFFEHMMANELGY